MITHKEAIEEISYSLKTGKYDAEVYEEILQLLQSEMWHPFPEEKPEEEGAYMIQVSNNEIVYAQWLESGKWVNEEKVIAWRKIMPYEEDI